MTRLAVSCRSRRSIRVKHRLFLLAEPGFPRASFHLTPMLMMSFQHGRWLSASETSTLILARRGSHLRHFLRDTPYSGSAGSSLTRQT
jgi:hypothetical protein